MRLCFVFVLIWTFQIFGCDLTGGPGEVQKTTEIQVRQYFPDAHAIVSPQQGTILVVTCTQGLGKAAITEIAKYLENNRGIQRLQRARHLPVKLSPYRFFFLFLIFTTVTFGWIPTLSSTGSNRAILNLSSDTSRFAVTACLLPRLLRTLEKGEHSRAVYLALRTA